MNTQNTHSIFVGGLSNTITNQDLLAYFGQFGNLVSCEVQMWKNNPTKCRGFAIIQVDSQSAYERILNQTHKLQGRAIECKTVIQDKTQLDSHSKEEQEKKIFVSGLCKRVDDEHLRTFFSQFGEVRMAYVVKHHKDKKSRGIGYVSFKNKESKVKALAATGLVIEGKNICCSEYSTKYNLKQASLAKTSAKSTSQEHEEAQTDEPSPKASLANLSLKNNKIHSVSSTSAKASLLRSLKHRQDNDSSYNLRFNKPTRAITQPAHGQEFLYRTAYPLKRMCLVTPMSYGMWY